ncbi:MAG: flagellar biosynthetic protein FliR [Alphaproteobacteria bacterium]|nr:flagellar biosynthetic protein FliR [Alphaproteobacteria bacterium]
MFSLNLDQQLSGHAFAFVLVFTRVGAAMMLFPGIAEIFVSARIRLMFALSISFLVFLPLLPILPVPPNTISEMVLMIFREMVIGVFFGSFLRLVMSATETAGAVIALQMGLSNAMILNPAMASQSALSSVFLSTAAMVLIFLTGLDHMLLTGIIDTYTIFPPNDFLPPGDMVHAYVKLTTEAFAVGVELSAPFLIIGLLINIILGFMQKLIPQVQLFLVAIPLHILGGLFLFSLTIGAIMSVWLMYFNNTLSSFIIK